MTNKHYHEKVYTLQYKFDGEDTWIHDSSYSRLSSALSVYFNVNDQKEAGVSWRVRKP